MCPDFLYCYRAITCENFRCNCPLISGDYLRMVTAFFLLHLPKTFFLVPGYGAQGGTAEDLKHCFNADGFGAVVNSSRGIIAAYKKDAYAAFGAEHFGEASRQAVLDMIADIGRVL